MSDPPAKSLEELRVGANMVTMELRRGRSSSHSRAPGLPAASARLSPGAPCGRRPRRAQPLPGRRPLATRGLRLVPPTRPPQRLAIGPRAPRAADWRLPQPAPGSPNARRPYSGIGRSLPRPALRSPARQRVSGAESLRGPSRVSAAPGR